ncbi:hypothetical protein Esti_004236 [Eimeria stiedai]
MADIRRFFASEGFTGASNKKPSELVGAGAPARSSSNSSSRNSSSSNAAATAAAKALKKTAAPAAQGKGEKPVAAAKQPKGVGVAKKGSRGKKLASSSSSSSGSDDNEAASSSSDSSSSSSGDDENFSPAKTEAPRKGGKLRRAIASDSEDDCAAIDPRPSSSSSRNSGCKVKGSSSSSNSSKGGGTRCVILEQGESDSDEAPVTKPSKKAKPAVTLKKFLKLAAVAAKQQEQPRQQQQQQQQQKQRVEVDVDAFFAAAATKELEKHKRSAAAAAAPAAAKEEKEAAVEAAADVAEAEENPSASMPVDGKPLKKEKLQEMKLGSPSPYSKKRKLPFAADKNSAAAAAEAEAEAAAAAEKPAKKPKGKGGSSSKSSSSSSSEVAGKKVVLTGVLQRMTREAAVEQILAAGGSVTTAVSGRTDLLVAGSVLEDGRLARLHVHVYASFAAGKKKENPKSRFSAGGFGSGMFPPTLNLNARACLLSGPPGIGKTTAATVAARLQGLQLLEFNASDTRNKAHIEELQDLVTGGVTVNFFQLDRKNKEEAGDAPAQRGKLPCLLLDEVDGLSGGDRGGSQAMIKLIDETRIPIICVCNDRMSTKVRTLAGRCLDLRFERPTAAALKSRMQQIANAENIPISEETLAKIAEVSGGDMRQCVGQLQLLAAQLRHSAELRNSKSVCAGKDAQVTLGPFECCKLLLDSRTGKRLKLWEKLDYFFVDYDMLPLLIQENYLTAIGHGVQQRAGGAARGGARGPSAELEGLVCSARAARALAIADSVSSTLRTSQDWSLLPTLGAFCCVDVAAEVHKVKGFIPRVNFPAWFGRNSTQTKNKRLFSELLLQLLRNPTSGSGIGSLKLSGYLDALYAMAVAPLLEEGDPKGTADRLAAYGLRREHLVEHIQSLMLRRQERLYERVDSKSKAAFTRHCSTLQQQVQVHLSKASRKAKGTESLKQALEGDEADLASDGSASESEGGESEQPKKRAGASSKRGGRALGGGPSKGPPRGTPKAAAASRGRGGGGGRRGGKAKA